MPTEIDPTRRQWLLGATATALLPTRAWARSAAPAWLAAWDSDTQQHYVGRLVLGSQGVRREAALEVPTRAHGLLVEPRGNTALAVARRPGDWLLRFDTRNGRALTWHWIDPEAQFNGHAVLSPDGLTLYTTQTDRETGEGRIGVHDARTLELRERWPSGGRDPHQLLAGPDGGLWVANGGIDTRPETGRRKHELERMDSSLVRLDANSGRVLGQWRVDDQRLSLRHMAFGPGGCVGIAMQAEHDEPEQRATAPVLAVWHAQRGLRVAPCNEPTGGYGGDIAAWREGFVVSCPRRDRAVWWRVRADGSVTQHDTLAHEGAYALAAGRDGEPTVAGAHAVWTHAAAQPLPRGMLVDNHWQQMPGRVG